MSIGGGGLRRDGRVSRAGIGGDLNAARGAEGRTANRGSFRLPPVGLSGAMASRTGWPTLRRCEKGLFEIRVSR